MRRLLVLSWTAWALPAWAAELKLDFTQFPVDQPPPGFRSLVAGQGRPGDWRVIMDEVPPLLAPLTDKAPVITRRAVLAQLAQDPTDEHFPLLVYEGETFADFTLTTRFKTVKGEREQMAGVVFRLQDERNFYVIRASSLSNTLRFYKMVAGQRAAPIGPQLDLPQGVWHELAVECRGNQIRCRLNGKEALPVLTDSSFARGKLGFWTKSDAVSYFTDTRITYTPQEVLAQKLVRDALAKFSRLRDLKIVARKNVAGPAVVVAAKEKSALGEAGGPTEAKVLAEGVPYRVKGKGIVTVVLPLRDRNGDVIAAVRVTMSSFLGETEESALVRALPVVKGMQPRVTSLEELTQ